MTVILSDLLIAALNEIKDSKTLAGLDDIRVRYLGKKGKITTQLKLLGSMDPNEKPIFGQEINATKKRVEDELQLKKIFSISINVAVIGCIDPDKYALPGNVTSIELVSIFLAMVDFFSSVFLS